MPFENRTVMEQKLEFCMLAQKAGTNFSKLCRRYHISRPTGYKWLFRYQLYGMGGLLDLSRKPGTFPMQLSADIEEYIHAIREENPAWGAKKIHKIMINQRLQGEYPFGIIPCKNTITRVFERHGMISDDKRHKIREWKRFEYEKPNALWQMDFKGHFQLLNQTQCHPLTILDDHSRFNLGLFACKNEQHETVKNHLIGVFRKYGLPDMILSDNGPPWSACGQATSEEYTVISGIEKWLIRLDIKPIHGHAYHPQTQGKEERFHRTLKEELLSQEKFKDQKHCQVRFDTWREKYNCKRPHEAIDFDIPISRYQQSSKVYPEVLPKIEYDSGDFVRKVGSNGEITFKNCEYRIGKAFIGDYVALRATCIEKQYDVYFCNQKIKTVNVL